MGIETCPLGGNGTPVTLAAASHPQFPAVPNVTDALKFNGPAPELINGRLAMLGFVAGALEETHSGLTFAQQAAQLPLSELLLLALWVYASLVPILKGAKLESFGEHDGISFDRGRGPELMFHQ